MMNAMANTLRNSRENSHIHRSGKNMFQLRKRSLAATSVVIFAVFSSVAMTGCSESTATSAVSTASPSVQSSAQAGETPSISPPRMLPIPAPSGGSITQVVPDGTAGPVTKVGMDKSADLPGQVSISISKIDSLTTTATTPGEIAGPAVAMFVSIHNGSANPINVDSVVVTLTDPTSGLGQPTTSAPYQPFAGDLAAGASAQGAYVFLMPTTDRHDLTMSVEYAAGQASAQFVGDVS
ncbi:hypothetical protein [Arthrobacter sp. GMC3]|uniref:hypothetical protein n=1 Tax=Arthrobacter sp. GMC3 TaxID=2058894 RepID=UPI0011B05ED6|nr:hypothetical protein [Arthrobacter sp. GMC3]